jgi:hypothetical protein
MVRTLRSDFRLGGRWVYRLFRQQDFLGVKPMHSGEMWGSVCDLVMVAVLPTKANFFGPAFGGDRFTIRR